MHGQLESWGTLVTWAAIFLGTWGNYTSPLAASKEPEADTALLLSRRLIKAGAW